MALSTLDTCSVDNNSNLVVFEFKSPGELLFREFVKGIWLASDVQVYLNLMHSEDSTREMAKLLLSERVGF